MSTQQSLLVTGGHGYIGSRFREIMARHYKIISPSHVELDILNKDHILKYLRIRHAAVINFAGFTDTREAEKQRDNERGTVWKTNVMGTQNLSDGCKEMGVFLIHISTNFVRTGTMKESDLAETDYSKLSWYAFSKAQAERILYENQRSAIVRIGSAVNDATQQKDHLRKIRDEYPECIDDRRLSMTPISMLSEALDRIVSRRTNGISHVACSNSYTAYDVAKVLRGSTPIAISWQKAVDKGISLPYEKDCVLDTEYTERRLDKHFPTWERVVDEILNICR
jgi:dTDP-4-dehydrorhamnose reductase